MPELNEAQARALAEQALKLSTAEACTVNLSGNVGGNIRYARNTVSTAGATEDLSLVVTAFYGKRSGTATANQFDAATLERTVRAAEALAKLAPEDPESMPPLGPQQYTPIPEAYAEGTARVSPEYRALVAEASIGPARERGCVAGEEVFTEDSQAGNDYLAQVTKQWQESVDKISSLSLRVVKRRIGIVLSDKGEALVEMAKPIRWGIGAPLGNGKQYLSWIHLDDLCAVFIRAVEDETMQGAYNAVSGEWITNKELTQLIAKILKRPLLLPNMPGLIMRIIIGEMAVIVVNGSKVSGDKIKRTGFEFNHSDLPETLRSLLVESKK